MSGRQYSSRPRGLARARAPRALAGALSALLLALVSAGSAYAVEPVEIGQAHDYSVLATTLTSNGPTAMSDNLGVWPGTTFAGDTAPIVLAATHLGDAQADAAMKSVNHAYGDAVLRPSTGAVPADLAGASVGPGVYNASGAVGFTAGGVLTLDAQGDPDAVFIFQIGAALTVGAGARVNLVGGADACNVFWAVGAATSIGANAKFAGTVMTSSAAIGLGAGSRLDGRVLGGGAVTLSGNAIRTACSHTVVVTGPAGPPGPPGATGAGGVQGPEGEVGANGAPGTDGTDGRDGARGPTGAGGAAGAVGADGIPGLNGPQGLIGVAGAGGATGLTGPTGLAGLAGADGPPGPASVVPPATRTTLCVTKKPSRRKVRHGGVVRWTIVVKNCGERAAAGVSVTDRLHKGASFRNRGGGSLIDGELRWKVGTLAAGASRTYATTTRFGAHVRGRYINSATADGDNTQPATGRGSTAVKSGR